MKRIRCTRCDRLLASKIEESALRKLRKTDPSLWEKLQNRRCRCVKPQTSAFTSRPQPMDLQAHDKFDR